MRKYKKVIGAVLASAMVVGALAGCGGSSSSSGSSSESSDKTWKIGVIGPMTGGAAAYGTAVRNGAQIAVKEINKAGGINGYKVELKYEDDELDAQKSVNAYNTLKDWGMQMLDGPTTSACDEAVIEYTNQDKMFQLTPSATSLNSVKYPNVFRMCFSDPNQGVESAKYIKENSLATKVGVIYDSSDTYSSGINTAFQEEAKKVGLSVVSNEAFNADNKTDFSVQLQKAKDAGADLVFLPIYYTEASLILQQANKMDYHPTFFGCDGMDGILGVENFDTSMANNLMLMTPFSAFATDDATVSFVDTYKKANDEVPNQFGADSYDAIYAMKAAAEKADVTPDMEVSEICEKMEKAMTEIKFTGLTGEDITWEESGEPDKYPKVYVIEDGTYKDVQGGDSSTAAAASTEAAQ